MTKLKLSIEELPKDDRITLRVNENIKEELQKKGVSLQALFDKALDQALIVHLEIKVK